MGDAAGDVDPSNSFGAQAENLSMGIIIWQPGASAFSKPKLVKVHICAEQQEIMQGSHTSMPAAEIMEGNPPPLCCMHSSASCPEQDQLVPTSRQVNTAILTLIPALSKAGQTCPQSLYCNGDMQSN